MTSVSVPKVSESIRLLRSMRVHPHFTAYLHLAQLAHQNHSRRRLEPNFKSFYDEWLQIRGAHARKPYLLIFTDITPSVHNLWLNSNIAGSLAPSSLRGPAPGRATLKSVVEIEGQGREARWSLVEGHWTEAHELLANGQLVPIVELATVLYRDYSFKTEDMTLSMLVEVFKQDFGYIEGADEEFRSLFLDDSDSRAESEWLVKG